MAAVDLKIGNSVQGILSHSSGGWVSAHIDVVQKSPLIFIPQLGVSVLGTGGLLCLLMLIWEV